GRHREKLRRSLAQGRREADQREAAKEDQNGPVPNKILQPVHCGVCLWTQLPHVREITSLGQTEQSPPVRPLADLFRVLIGIVRSARPVATVLAMRYGCVA